MKLWIAAALATIAQPAAASWQYTKWGMTPDEVRRAADRPVLLQEFPRLSTSLSKVKAGTTYEAGGLKFTVLFGFDQADRLNGVTLELQDRTRCVDLNSRLRSVYGAPLPMRRLGLVHLARWRDEKAGNEVSLMAIGGLGGSTCTLEYRPILSRKETGL